MLLGFSEIIRPRIFLIHYPLLSQFGVQKESMTGIATARYLPNFSCWPSIVQLHTPETHVSLCISVKKLDSAEEWPQTM